MGRKVKCHITGAWGTSDTFVKIGNHYYKNQYVYDEDHRLKEERKQLIDYICKKFLHYADGQPFHTSLPKKLNELSFYDNTVILETFKTCESDILYWLEHKNFTNDYGKIAYMFAIIGNNIADVNRKYINEQKIAALQQSQIRSFELSDEHKIVNIGTKQKAKDISDFLED